MNSKLLSNNLVVINLNSLLEVLHSNVLIIILSTKKKNYNLLEMWYI